MTLTTPPHCFVTMHAPPLPAARQVHLQSQARHDSAGDCAICLRPFRAEGQVLLSCSHTFHQHCLAALERFARQHGAGGAACCPLCRAAAYEKKRIDDAERLWRHACAARIQAAWHGLQARRAYRALRRLLPPSHPALRRRWAAEALGELGAQFVDSVDSGTAEVDALFAELDASSAAAGAVYQELSSRCQQQQQPQQPAPDADGASGAAAAAAGGGSTVGDSPADAGPAAAAASTALAQQQRTFDGSSEPNPTGPSSSASNGGTPPAGVQQPNWEEVVVRCLQRDEQPECAICLAPLGQLFSGSCGGGTRSSNSSSSSSEGRSASKQRSERQGGQGSARAAAEQPSGIAVLSCSHAYHADCLSAFEAFAMASELAPACPCCRSVYARMDLC